MRCPPVLLLVALCLTSSAARADDEGNPALTRANLALGRADDVLALTHLAAALVQADGDDEHAVILARMAQSQWALGRTDDAEATLAALWRVDSEVVLEEAAPDALVALRDRVFADLDARSVLTLEHAPPTLDGGQVQVPLRVRLMDRLDRVAAVRVAVAFNQDGKAVLEQRVLLTSTEADRDGWDLYDGAFTLPSAAAGPITQVSYTFEALDHSGHTLPTQSGNGPSATTLDVPPPPMGGWVPVAALSKPGTPAGAPQEASAARPFFGVTTGLALATGAVLGLAALAASGALSVALVQILGTQVDLKLTQGQKTGLVVAAAPLMAATGLLVVVVVVLAATTGGVGIFGWLRG
jgi:hypothetical protein